MSILRNGKQPKEGQHMSRRLEGLHLNRFNKIKDLFHKVSYHIVQLAIKEDLHTIIIGKNK